jgi:hypothetical protein
MVKKTMYDEKLDDDALDLGDASAAITTLEPDEEVTGAAAERTGPRCEKCAAPLKSDVVTICRSCGWYPSLGRFVEVDKNWDFDDDSLNDAPQPTQKSHLRVWIDLIPRWGWVIIGSVFAVVVESVAVRLLTPAGSSLRTTWSLTQLAFGLLAFAGCHIFNFLVLAAEDADVGTIDLVMKPVKLWMRAAHNLPARLWLSNTAATSVTAAVMSPLVIGGLPYERLWDWGIEAPTKQELMGAVMDRVKKLESRNGADNLEDAIGDFAGTADGLSDQQTTPETPREKADCVILGYKLDRDGNVESFELGTNYLARLVYAGRVKPQMPADEKASLIQRLKSIRTHQPLIPIQAESVVWVKPKYACRVSFEYRKKGQLYGVKWERLLGRIGAQ